MYTLGLKEIYDPGIDEYGEEFKKDVGGSVWESVFDVVAYVYACHRGGVDINDFVIYAVDGDWGTDTRPAEFDTSASGFWRRLIVPRTIRRVLHQENYDTKKHSGRPRA